MLLDRKAKSYLFITRFDYFHYLYIFLKIFSTASKSNSSFFKVSSKAVFSLAVPEVTTFKSSSDNP